ncbi:Alpha-L-fucosidase [Novipirellula aureliae]|uniref:alpha-L-fucosidase n=1 Tax=Novipirellula aureliae TaxID=2527966 RepID=A0A5C6DDN2_9BACT|nr:alpha-L-fucosidase [Novipirellula aureliae]TWU35353.1 Alpha-L-fucosidase [Novipirellula aureliae]
MRKLILNPIHGSGAAARVALAMGLLLGSFSCGNVIAEDPQPGWTFIKETPEEHAAKMEWWNTARFGMFVHWGVYSVTGGEYRGKMPTNSAEWMMNKARIPIADYRTENVDKFNPTEFDADAFVGLAKEAGMKYLVITAKHHDGFSMFGSKASPYNVVDATPFKRDIMRELAEACKAQGIRFGFYYSQCQDWHHPGGIGNNWDKTIQRVSFDEYVREKAAPEIRQLLTEYGPISIFWWDTPRDMSKEAFDSLHSGTDLQPGIITNDRLGEEYAGDHKTFERKIPSEAPVGVDWEVCMPISGSWGYKKSDRDFKSSETLIRNLADIASKGGNYLLNVSPTGAGTLLPEATERLKTIGKWMKVNGESIYGTTASPFEELEWGRCTKKEFARGTTLYLHVFDWPKDGKLFLPGLQNKVEQAYLMADWQALNTQSSDLGVEVSLPEQAPDEINSVVVVNVSGALEIKPVLPTPNEDGTLTLSADMAYIHNNEGGEQASVREGRRREASSIGNWSDENAWVEWSFRIDSPGRYEVSAEFSLQDEKSRFRLGQPGQLQTVEVTSTGTARDFTTKSLATLNIDEAGDCILQIKPEKGSWSPIGLRKLVLTKQ